MTTDLSWLVGRSLTEVVRYEHSWAFVFGPSESICTSAFWRLVTSERIIVTSEDDGHPFGLGFPVDARKWVLDTIGSAKVVRASIENVTSDLVVVFDDRGELHFLNTSCGYESWTANRGAFQTICMGGGGVSSWEDKTAQPGATDNPDDAQRFREDH